MSTQMECPWCEFSGAPRALHAHFGTAHPEGVRFETRGARNVYVVECPICHAGYDQTIKPGTQDPTFLEEFQREIRLVGFDMLVNHLLATHGDSSHDAQEEQDEQSDPTQFEEGANGVPQDN